MQPNTHAFLPTGEVRPVTPGDHYCDGMQVLYAEFAIARPRPIYRAVPADSVIELTPEVRCELAFARMYRTWNVRIPDSVARRFSELVTQYELSELGDDLADAMQRLTKEMEGAK